MLLDYPNHPAGALIQQSVPISLYGTLGLFVFESFASKNDVFFQCENLHLCFGQSIWPFNFSIWAGRWWRASAWRLIYGVSLATRPVTSAEKCWPEPIHGHYNPFDFLCVLVSHIHQSIFEVSFCEIDQKVWNKWIINAQIGVWWCCQFDLAKSGKSHPWVHQRIIWPWGGYSWVWRCSSAVRIYTFLFFDQNKKGKMSDSYVTIFWWLQTKDAGSLNFIFSSWTSRGTGSTFVSYSIWNGTHPPNRPGGPCDIQTTYGCRDLEPDLWPYSWFLAHWKPKNGPILGRALNSFFKFLQ